MPAIARSLSRDPNLRHSPATGRRIPSQNSRKDASKGDNSRRIHNRRRPNTDDSPSRPNMGDNPSRSKLDDSPNRRRHTTRLFGPRQRS